MIRKVLVAFVLLFPVNKRFKILYYLSIIVNPFYKLWLQTKKDKKWAYSNAFGPYAYERYLPLSLNWLIRELTTLLIPPKIVFDVEQIKLLAGSDKGVFITCYHGTFMPLIVSCLTDNGLKIHTWSKKTQEVRFGRIINHSFKPSSKSFLQVRDCMREGKIVAAMIDFPDKISDKVFQIDSTLGKMWITDSFFRILANVDCEIVFVKYKFKRGTVVFTVGKPELSERTSENITREYQRFMQN